MTKSQRFTFAWAKARAASHRVALQRGIRCRPHEFFASTLKATYGKSSAVVLKSTARAPFSVPWIASEFDADKHGFSASFVGKWVCYEL